MSNIFLPLSYLLHSKNNFKLHFRFFIFLQLLHYFPVLSISFFANINPSFCICCIIQIFLLFLLCFPCMTSIFSISSGLSSPSTIHIYVTLILQISKTTPVIIIIPIIRLINHLFLSLLSYNGLINLDTFSDRL